MNNCMAINHAKILQNWCNSSSRWYFHIVLQLPDWPNAHCILLGWVLKSMNLVKQVVTSLFLSHIQTVEEPCYVQTQHFPHLRFHVPAAVQHTLSNASQSVIPIYQHFWTYCNKMWNKAYINIKRTTIKAACSCAYVVYIMLVAYRLGLVVCPFNTYFIKPSFQWISKIAKSIKGTS